MASVSKWVAALPWLSAEVSPSQWAEASLLQSAEVRGC
jgi:hypothetical protein